MIPTPTTQVPGRKRDASRDDDLCQATLDLLVEVGYDRLTVDAVAARACAGKATVYRRWASKAELVVEAVSRMKAAAEQPDTGSLRGDLVALTCHFGKDVDPLRAGVVGGLVSGLAHDARLRDVFAEHFIKPRKDVFLKVFERAVERGEIAPHPNFELLAEIVPALAIHGLIMNGRPPDGEYVLAILDQIVLPLVTGRPAAGTAADTANTDIANTASSTTPGTTPSEETRRTSS